MKKILVLLIFCVCATFATTKKNLSPKKVSSIQVRSDGWSYFTLEGAAWSDFSSACQTTSHETVLAIRKTDPAYYHIMAFLNMALANGLSLFASVNTDEGIIIGTRNYCLLKTLSTKQ